LIFAVWTVLTGSCPWPHRESWQRNGRCFSTSWSKEAILKGSSEFQYTFP